MSNKEYSVCQFFNNGTHEYVVRFVSPEEALDKALFYTNNIASRFGITRRVIITDGMDCINWEWEFGKGVIFPTEDDLKK